MTHTSHLRVGPSRSARLLRLGGIVLTATFALELLPALWRDPNQLPDSIELGLVFLVVLATILFAFLTLTAERTGAAPRALNAAAGSAVAAAACWAVVAVVFRPVPTDLTAAVEAIAAGMLVAGMLGAGLPLTDGTHTGRWRRGGLAALSAGVIGSLLIVQVVLILSTFGPPSLIPDLAPAALTAADDLAQSRNELQDPYVVVAFGGFVLAALLVAALLVARVVTARVVTGRVVTGRAAGAQGASAVDG